MSESTSRTHLIIRLLLCHALGAGLSTVAHMQCQPGSITNVDLRGDSTWCGCSMTHVTCRRINFAGWYRCQVPTSLKRDGLVANDVPLLP
jgi:hypothetical protein